MFISRSYISEGTDVVDVSTEWILNISVILNATARDSSGTNYTGPVQIVTVSTTARHLRSCFCVLRLRPLPQAHAALVQLPDVAVGPRIKRPPVSLTFMGATQFSDLNMRPSVLSRHWLSLRP